MYNSIGGGRKLVAFYFWEKPACRDIIIIFFFVNKALRHQIHTFQSSLHREAGILTLIQRDEPENLSTDPTLLSNISTNLKEKRERENERKKEKKPFTFQNCLDTWFPDAVRHQAE